MPNVLNNHALFRRSKVVDQGHSSESVDKEHHAERDHTTVHDRTIGVELLLRHNPGERHERRPREDQIKERTKPVRFERAFELTMNEGGPACGKSAAWAWAIKNKRTGARREAKLLVRAVTIGAWV